MTTLHDLMPDTAALLMREPEELAGLGLELIASTNAGGPSRLNTTSFTHPETVDAVPHEHRAAVER